MAAGTVVTAISLPIYFAFFHWYGAMGLAFASDIGIAMQTLAIALLLHQRHMVSLASLDYREWDGACWLRLAEAERRGLCLWLGGVVLHALGAHLPAHSRWIDLAVLAGGIALWGAVAISVLKKTGSALPGVMMRRLRLA